MSRWVIKLDFRACASGLSFLLLVSTKFITPYPWLAILNINHYSRIINTKVKNYFNTGAKKVPSGHGDYKSEVSIVAVSSYGRNIKALREREGLTQQQLADVLGVTQNTIGGWETRDKRPKQQSIIDDICRRFNVTQQDLFGFSDGLYAQQTGLGMMREARSFDNKCPIAGSISAGNPDEAIEYTGEYAEVPSRYMERWPSAFVLIVKGDSMDQLFLAGSRVLVVPSDDLEVKTGDIAAIKVNGDEATIKEIRFVDDFIVLVPHSNNPEHKRRIIDPDDPDAPEVKVLGRVVWADRDFISL